MRVELIGRPIGRSRLYRDNRNAQDFTTTSAGYWLRCSESGALNAGTSKARVRAGGTHRQASDFVFLCDQNPASVSRIRCVLSQEGIVWLRLEAPSIRMRSRRSLRVGQRDDGRRRRESVGGDGGPSTRAQRGQRWIYDSAPRARWQDFYGRSRKDRGALRNVRSLSMIVFNEVRRRAGRASSKRTICYGHRAGFTRRAVTYRSVLTSPAGGGRVVRARVKATALAGSANPNGLLVTPPIRGREICAARAAGSRGYGHGHSIRGVA